MRWRYVCPYPDIPSRVRGLAPPVIVGRSRIVVRIGVDTARLTHDNGSAWAGVVPHTPAGYRDGGEPPALQPL